MDPRLEKKYGVRLDELFEHLESQYSDYGFKRKDVIELCKVKVPSCLKDRHENKNNYDRLQQATEQIASLSDRIKGSNEFGRAIGGILTNLEDLEVRLRAHLEEKNGPICDRVFYSVMRYLIYFRLQGKALYSAAVGICIFSQAVPASDFGMLENIFKMFDPLGHVPREPRFNERIKKKYDRLFIKYDEKILEEWEPADPTAQLSVEEKEAMMVFVNRAAENLGLFIDGVVDGEIEKKKGQKREALSGLGLMTLRKMRDSKRPKKSKSKRQGSE
ncbi:MAG: hypothetical protein O3B73_02565 [bacterium]|nr:hypothetical protein [bacterium]